MKRRQRRRFGRHLLGVLGRGQPFSQKLRRRHLPGDAFEQRGALWLGRLVNLCLEQLSDVIDGCEKPIDQLGREERGLDLVGQPAQRDDPVLKLMGHLRRGGQTHHRGAALERMGTPHELFVNRAQRLRL